MRLETRNRLFGMVVELMLGSREVAAKYPGITIRDVYYHKETAQDAAAKVEQVMQANPDITGWAMIGGWPLFTKSLLTDLDPAKVKVVAVDCLPAELPYIEKGIAPVLLAQPTYKWSVSGGRITSGQGTGTIEVQVDRTANDIIATVEITNFPRECNNQASCAVGSVASRSTNRAARTAVR